MNRKKYFFVIAFYLILSTTIIPQNRLEKLSEISWIQIDSMNEARFQHAMVVLPDGNILVSGGSEGENNLSKRSAEIYDFSTGK